MGEGAAVHPDKAVRVTPLNGQFGEYKKQRAQKPGDVDVKPAQVTVKMEVRAGTRTRPGWGG